MPATKQDLFDFLDYLSIKHTTTDHAPVFTVDEGLDIKAKLPGGHTKNLFLKDKSGALFLVCALGDTPIKINRLHPVLDCKRLSFGNPELLLEHLGVTPGSVTLFSLINDKDGAVTLVLDKALLNYDIVNFHPLLNDATTAITFEDMVKFAHATDHAPTLVDFAELED